MTLKMVFLMHKIFIFILCVMCFVHLYVCTGWIPGSHGDQKRAPDALEPDLGTVLSCFVGAEN